MRFGDPRALSPDILAHRAALTDILIAYGGALDARDWGLFRGLFFPEVAVDYSAMGSLQATLAADAWTDRCRALERFDATHHKLTNFAFEVEGGVARGSCLVDAAHFLTHEGRTLGAFVLGRYDHRLRLTAGGWKIEACAFTVAGYPGGKAAFDEAFAIIRALHAKAVS